MYGCYDAYYVYGIFDSKNYNDLIYDYDEIEKIGLWYLSDKKNCLCDPVYGIIVDEKTTDEQKK